MGAVTYGFVDIPELYDRHGTLYGPGGAGEWPDNHVRFAALGAAVPHAAPLILDGPLDVLHVHDWQGSPAAIYAHLASPPRPTIIATDVMLGVHPSSTYTYFVICSPVGAYYKEGVKPVRILVSDNHVRAVQGGLGEALLRVYSLLDGRTRLGDLASRVRSPEARLNLLRLTYLLVQTDLARLS